MDVSAVLQKARLKNVIRVLIGHININSARSKFDMLTFTKRDNTNIFMVSETKLNSSFTNAQFVIERYAPPFRYDRNCHVGGILLFIREDILAKMLSTASTNDFEVFFVDWKFWRKNFFGAAPITLTKVRFHVISYFSWGNIRYFK